MKDDEAKDESSGLGEAAAGAASDQADGAAGSDAAGDGFPVSGQVVNPETPAEGQAE